MELASYSSSINGQLQSSNPLTCSDSNAAPTASNAEVSLATGDAAGAGTLLSTCIDSTLYCLNVDALGAGDVLDNDEDDEEEEDEDGEEDDCFLAFFFLFATGGNL